MDYNPSPFLVKCDTMLTYIDLYVDLIDAIGDVYKTNPKETKLLRQRLYKLAIRGMEDPCLN